MLYSVLHFYDYFARCTFMNSYICIVAPHLCTIDEPREGRDVGAEPADGEWWTHLEAVRMDPDVHDQKKTLVMRVSSN